MSSTNTDKVRVRLTAYFRTQFPDIDLLERQQQVQEWINFILADPDILIKSPDQKINTGKHWYNDDWNKVYQDAINDVKTGFIRCEDKKQ